VILRRWSLSSSVSPARISPTRVCEGCLSREIGFSDLVDDAPLEGGRDVEDSSRPLVSGVRCTSSPSAFELGLAMSAFLVLDNFKIFPMVPS